MNAVVLAASRPRWREFLALTKPRVVALMVFTAMIGMLLAPPGAPDPALFLVASLGIALVAGGAAACNCLAERGIDARMARTRARPLPRGGVTPTETALFAAALAASGLGLLWWLVNPLAMVLTALTFFGYSVVYTRWLKPATPQNIVIGGAAGAFPPMIGWAAVTGTVSVESIVLFLIIFMWTPPHFWALSLFKRGDYEAARVPMLPVVAGEDATRTQILIYSVLLAPIGVAPAPLGFASLAYGVAAAALGIAFVWYAVRVHARREGDAARKAAVRLFAFSLVYLFLIFALLLADSIAARLVAGGWL